MNNFVFAEHEPHFRDGDPLIHARQEKWTFDLLDTEDRLVRTLEGVEPGGKLTHNVNAVIRTGGSLTYKGPDVDWDLHRIKITYGFDSIYGPMSWPMGVFLPVTPEDDFDNGVKTQSLELMDKLSILDDDKIDKTFAIRKGLAVTRQIRLVIESAGETTVSIIDSPITTRTHMVWEPNTTKLRIVNDLLASINYFSLYADGNGILHGTPYVKPMNRPVVRDFQAGPECIFVGQFTHVHDNFHRPNKFIAIAKSDGKEPALRGVATDDKDYAKRKRWVTDSEENIDAANQEIIQDIAEKRLSSRINAKSSLTLKHAALPINLNNRVTFKADGVNLTGVVQSMEVPLSVGGLTTTKILEVDNGSF